MFDPTSQEYDSRATTDTDLMVAKPPKSPRRAGGNVGDFPDISMHSEESSAPGLSAVMGGEALGGAGIE